MTALDDKYPLANVFTSRIENSASQRLSSSLSTTKDKSEENKKKIK